MTAFFSSFFPEKVSSIANHLDIKNGDAVESNRTPSYRERFPIQVPLDLIGLYRLSTFQRQGLPVYLRPTPRLL